MERLATQKPEVTRLLTVQYRMHPDIMHFSSTYFYHGLLQADTSVMGRSVLDLDSPMLWFDTSPCDHYEQQPTGSTSRVNSHEATLLVRLVEEYVTSIGQRRFLDERIDMGIISPYEAQISLLRSLVKRSSTLRSLRRQISIHTVDGFQGQERDVIVISTVRANADGRIGFLRDLRRMNVAITRARHKVIIVGNATTLTRHPFYASLLDHIRRVGRVVEVNE